MPVEINEFEIISEPPETPPAAAAPPPTSAATALTPAHIQQVIRQLNERLARVTAD